MFCVLAAFGVVAGLAAEDGGLAPAVIFLVTYTVLFLIWRNILINFGILTPPASEGAEPTRPKESRPSGAQESGQPGAEQPEDSGRGHVTDSVIGFIIVIVVIILVKVWGKAIGKWLGSLL